MGLKHENTAQLKENKRYNLWVELVTKMNNGNYPNKAFYKTYPEMTWEIWSEGIKPKGTKLKTLTKAKPQKLCANGIPKKDRQVTFSITADQRSTFHALAKTNGLKTIDLFNMLLTKQGREQIAKLKQWD